MQLRRSTSTDSCTPRPTDWLVPLRRTGGEVRQRIVLFAHSGSGPNALLSALRWVAADVELVGVLLPGRERRFREPCTEILADPGSVVDTIAEQLQSLPPLPTVFFGHSLGAQLAMAVATREPASCHGLVLSACPPSAPHTGDWSLTDDEVLDVVDAAGGDSRSILENPSLREHFLTVLRADLELGRRLAADPVDLALTPVVIGGADDELVPPAELSLLADQRGVPHGPHFLPGGHFYLLDEQNRSSVQLVVGRVLDSVRRGSAGVTRRPPAFGAIHELVGFQPAFSTHVTLEGLNTAGSIKLRTAHQLVHEAEQAGLLAPGGRIIESTSGNLGVAMAALCARKNYQLTLVMDPNANRRSIRMAESFGATVVQVTERDAAGGFLGKRIQYIEQRLAADPGLVWLNQYANEANVRAHSTYTAPEFLDAYGVPDWLFVGAGTTGTLMGCLDVVEARGLPTRVVAVDAAGSLLSGGQPATRRIPGIGASRVPEIFDSGRNFEMVAVPEADAVVVCRHVARRHGLLLGGSSGSVLAAVCMLRNVIEPGARVLAISADMGDGYLDTIYDDDWARREFGPEVLRPDGLALIEATGLVGAPSA